MMWGETDGCKLDSRCSGGCTVARLRAGKGRGAFRGWDDVTGDNAIGEAREERHGVGGGTGEVSRIGGALKSNGYDGGVEGKGSDGLFGD